MSLPPALTGLRIPVMASPLFIISSPGLLLAQCASGIIGAMPALNARSTAQLDEWLSEIDAARRALPPGAAGRPPAYAINLIAHRSNARLEADLEACIRHRVPIVITSLGAREDINHSVQAYGGITLHDVIDDRFAHKAIEKGASGLIAVAAGAGGHAGVQSPFALVQEIRSWFDGPLLLSGAIANGRSLLAARALGADLGYIGSAFIATEEANASDAYKAEIVRAGAADILYSNVFTGVHGNYLKASIVAAGLDPDNLPTRDSGITVSDTKKPWRDIWGAGQGIHAVTHVTRTAELVDRIDREYRQALAALRA